MLITSGHPWEPSVSVCVQNFRIRNFFRISLPCFYRFVLLSTSVRIFSYTKNSELTFTGRALLCQFVGIINCLRKILRPVVIAPPNPDRSSPVICQYAVSLHGIFSAGSRQAFPDNVCPGNYACTLGFKTGNHHNGFRVQLLKLLNQLFNFYYMCLLFISISTVVAAYGIPLKPGMSQCLLSIPCTP